MYKCAKCNKEFIFESEYNRHKNRKTPCNQQKEDLECKSCNLKFTRLFNKKKHEKTNKHIQNYNKYIQNNVNGDNIAGDKINNIINLTLNVNSFRATDTSNIRKNIIEDIGEYIYLEIINKKYLPEIDKVKKLFDYVIEILEKLHFNLDIEENHNLKILLMFPGIKKKVYEYLILEINPETKDIIWNGLDYKELMKQLFEHLYNLNNKIKNDNYDKFISLLKRYILTNEETYEELKPYIEETLNNMYINFNKKQKKEDREVKEEFNEKLNEYINYRSQECKLNNGFNPAIINSQV
jgi:DNA-directed RNA polymerase subunit RPC12/RpoP